MKNICERLCFWKFKLLRKVRVLFEHSFLAIHVYSNLCVSICNKSTFVIIPGIYLEPSQTPKMRLSVKTVNGFQTLAFFTKCLRCFTGFWIRLWVPHNCIKSDTRGPVFDFNSNHRILMILIHHTHGLSVSKQIIWNVFLIVLRQFWTWIQILIEKQFSVEVEIRVPKV